MHFCTQCGNMYYIRLLESEGSKIIYYCRKCGHENSEIENTNLTVSKTILKHKKQSFHHIINKYTKLDPTLPHNSTMKCPNAECICNTDESVESDIIYIKYDEENMKYVYLCTHCDTTWTNDTK